ncbi:MAG: 50S ribosomal protein L23 [Nitrososphaerota archaeon]|nr:50S ribosomal protein L23 [Nitrososphaerota archaeon]
MDPHEIIIRPVSTESAIERIERENKLIFIVNITSNKKMIKDAFEKLYGVKVERVNTYITPKGEKRAIIKLNKEYSASELATKLGLL